MEGSVGNRQNFRIVGDLCLKNATQYNIPGHYGEELITKVALPKCIFSSYSLFSKIICSSVSLLHEGPYEIRMRTATQREVMPLVLHLASQAVKIFLAS